MPDEKKEASELSRRVTIALVTPIALLVVAGSILGLQVFRMASDAAWVDHTDNVIAQAMLIQKQIIDQETGLRGYLLTEERLFLEPFEKAEPLQEIAELSALVGDDPGQVARTLELRRRYDFWMSNTASVTKNGPIAPSRTVAAMREGKREMDDIRAEMAEILNKEATLRRDRMAALEASTTFTKVAFIGLFGIVGLMLAFSSRRQLAAIAATFRTALDGEQAARQALEREDWLRTRQMALAEALQGDLSPEEIGARSLATLAASLGADIGAFFTADKTGWKRRAGHALDPRASGPETFGPGQGLVGTVAATGELVHLRDVPPDFFKLRSGTGERQPVEVALIPARLDKSTLAVIELGFLKALDPRSLDLLGRVGESVAVAVRSAEHKARLRDLYEESQRQGEELQAQQEELRVSNEELQEQTNAVRAAQSETERRQKDLEAINARLEEQTNAVLRSQREVTEKSVEVERASRYKSEFLANMSHELRTPLNSSLILAKLLGDNKDGNLTDEQVRFAQTISASGNDLLTLINDILDLSKIEAGKVDLTITTIHLRRMLEGLSRTLEPVAHEKGLTLHVEVDGTAPDSIESDAMRLEQILKNLLSNALKFTARGEVSLRASGVGATVRFVVKDTGIGIPKDQQGLIFDAFRQADGAATRKYGGTGLGLSISRDLAKLLGGEVGVESELDKGSVFTLTVPTSYVGPTLSGEPQPRQAVATHGDAPAAAAAKPEPKRAETSVSKPAFHDDRSTLDRRRRLVLVIEDDVAFAKILFDLAHEVDFQCIVAHDAESGLVLAKEHVPSAIILDVQLPDHSGLSVLDRLKHDATTRHVPVHVASVGDYAQTTLSMGAVGYMLKPVKHDELVRAFRNLETRLARRVGRLLIVEDDAVQRDSLQRLLAAPEVEIVAVGTVAEAREALRGGGIDCVVTDLTLPDASGFELLDEMGNQDVYASPPVIVYTGRSLTADEEQRLRKHSSSIIVKGARSPERLLDEVTLFLHQVESALPPEQRRMLKRARDREAIFDGRRILIVEDDVRNIFSLSSVLEPKGVQISIARNGREALAALESAPVDVVLMDIMMPEMDGFEAMRRIRQRPALAKLPIIALTAKAMKDDQERCLSAGASDYIAKPIDVEMLLSLLRIWMPK